MFSDRHKIRETVDGLHLEVEGGVVRGTEGDTGGSLTGGMSLLEAPRAPRAQKSLVFIVTNHHLQEQLHLQEVHRRLYAINPKQT